MILKIYEYRGGIKSQADSCKWSKWKKVLPRHYSPGYPECAAIDKNHGLPPDTVYLSPIRCTSARIEIAAFPMRDLRIKIRVLILPISTTYFSIHEKAEGKAKNTSLYCRDITWM